MIEKIAKIKVAHVLFTKILNIKREAVKVIARN